MKKNWSRWFHVPELNIYLFVILILSVVLWWFNKPTGLIALSLFVILCIYNWRAGLHRRVRWTQYLEDLSEDMDWAAKKAVMTVPLPVLTVEMDGRIVWYNQHMALLFKGFRLIGENIAFYISDLDPKKLVDDKDKHVKRVIWKDRYYDVIYYIVERGSIGNQVRQAMMLYWLDVTDLVQLQSDYQAQRPVVGLVYVDNYDDVMASAEEADRPAIAAELDKAISNWASALDSAWCKYDRDKYMLVFAHAFMAQLEQKRFDILDEVRDIALSNRIVPTLSIGVGLNAKDYAQALDMSRSAMELALGRGGDQAVVKDGDKFYFYGGKNRTVEKTSKVKSRVIAHALRRLMQEASSVFIMGHEWGDFDSIGAAIGLWRSVVNMQRSAYIVLDHGNPSIDSLLDELNQHKEYSNLFVTGEEAMARASANDLLIVVDIQRPSYTECPKLLEMISKIVVIDHHRRTADSIDNAMLTYLEPYASSTCELVTEILQYMGDKIKLQPVEAKALLAGIMVDTKNFAFKAGVRTFEAASLLRRMGADPTAVRTLFQDDLSTFSARARVVTEAKIEFPGIAVSISPPDIAGSNLIAAKAADALITIKGIHTSFVLTQVGDSVVISGRSLGDVNVQLVLEKLGGGGHLTMAGAQLANMSIEEAKQLLLNAIRQYLKEEGEKK